MSITQMITRSGLGLAVVIFFVPIVFAEKSSQLERERELVDEYCVVCHDTVTKSGGFSWDTLDIENPAQNAERAEKVIRKLRSGMMPPAGLPRPEKNALESLAGSLEKRVDAVAAVQPYTKAPILHRVNRREYRNSIRDLLTIEVDVEAILPPDSRTGGFDNLSDALAVTPALMQAYVRAADKISRLAVGDTAAPAIMTKFNVPKVENQMKHVPGTPFGTRGGLGAVHNFPADGEYTFGIELHYYYTGELIGSNLPESLQGQQIEISVDGERVFVFTIDPLQEESSTVMVTSPITIQAGPRQVAAAFVSMFDGPVEDQYHLVNQTLMDSSIALHAGMTALPHLQTLTVTGPINVTGISATPSRQKIFTCYPDDPSMERACADEILSNLATRAFRRPVTRGDLESLMEMYDVGRQGGDFETGVRTGVQAIIAKPEFVFRFERVPRDVSPGSRYRISDIELASRLSYFLWSTAPDEELLDIASNGKLSNEVVLDQQVKRMLSSPQASTLATNFAAQWLHLSKIEEIHPEPTIFPNYTKNLAYAMRREVELLFDSIIREDRNVLDLLTAEYTYVDETLAEHYGIPNVLGNRFRRVELDDPNRFGLLGKGAFLTVTSLATRTSPVARGSYVLEVLVGAPPPNPPADVPALKESVNNQRILTVRERMEEHRENPACSACHQIMDPIGLTLENFDATGRWRVSDGGLTIDPRAQMYDGTKLDGPASLRRALLERREAFVSSFAKGLLAYGLGRVLDYRDMPTVRLISREASQSNNHFSTFVLAIVKSAPFQMRTLDVILDEEEAEYNQ